MATENYFIVGGRYRNRKGWYEVLSINPDGTVRYRSEVTGENRDNGDPVILERIDREIRREEGKLIPYNDVGKNKSFFTTLGYICNHGFIEAMIPPQSKKGFDANYKKCKGNFPDPKIAGYFLHQDANVDKWGVELRLTYDKCSISLDFAGLGNPVSSPDNTKLRINSNALCYDLLARGFDLGDTFDTALIEGCVPDDYKASFVEGLAL